MARIVFVPEIRDDLMRFLRHMAEFKVPEGQSRVERLIRAIDILADNPRIGRPAGEGRRELVIGRPPHGYVALYRYAAALDTVFVLALRHQREAGFRRED